MLSPVSSHVFERSLVTKYIEQNGTDPINGEPLLVEQLLDIKGSSAWVFVHAVVRVFGRWCALIGNSARLSSLIKAHLTLALSSPLANPLVKPRPPSATSIPAILKLLQDEWVRHTHTHTTHTHTHTYY